MKFSLATLSLVVGVSQAFSRHESLDEPFQSSSFYKLSHSPCVTLYHRNGRAGCGNTDRKVQSGPIFYYDGSSSNNKPPNDGSDFVAVLEEYDLTAEAIDALLNGNNLKGIFVLNSTYANDDGETHSPGSVYPNGYGTPSAGIGYGNIQFPWNSYGDGLNLYDLYGIPMAYINSYEASGYIRESAQQKNNALEIYGSFNYYMGPDGVNSEECLAWKDAEDGKWNPKCLPLGGTSVWAFTGSPPKISSAGRQLEDAAAAAPEEEAADAVEGDGADAAAAEEEEGADAEADANADADADNNAQQQQQLNYGDGKPAIVIAASMDSTSMFHDLAPGANEGATNTLTLLMAAYLFGSAVSDSTLDALTNRVVFALFDGEAYGYMGSRRFLKDVLGFQCNDQYTVNSVANDANSDKACLYPMRPSLTFQGIGQIAGMLTVDQVGLPASSGNLYVHNDGKGGMGTFMANVLLYSGTGTQYYSGANSAASNQGNGEFPYPPTPLTALQSITNGQVGGAVLTGYDYRFNKNPPYQSHLNWAQESSMNYKAIAAAATMIARTALAAAYDSGSYDYATAAKFAYSTIGALDYEDETFVELAQCLHLNGNCKMLEKYASLEAKKDKGRTGFQGLSAGKTLGSPPNYYVGVYSADYGQPFVRVGKNFYGAYDGDAYGKSSTDAVGMQPKLLPQAVRGLLNHFLGQGSASTKDGSSSYSPRTCHQESDCKGVSYCGAQGDSATCTGGKVCVCSRAFYHIALDEAVEPASQKATGFFETSYDEGVSPLWAEPYWSNEVGIKMFRVAEARQGFLSLAAGGICLAACFFLAVIVKVGMVKEKVY